MITLATTLYLIRHGEVYNPNHTFYGRVVDIPLNGIGFVQMRTLAKNLQADGTIPNIIYTSPLKRTVQSSQAIVDIFPNIPIIPEDALLETDWRGLEGKPLAWAETIGGDVYACNSLDGFYIETPEAVAERMKNIINTVRVRHQGQTIFLVSHGDPIAFVRWSLLHPENALPSITHLYGDNYLNKSEAWKVMFNAEGQIIDQELIRV